MNNDFIDQQLPFMEQTPQFINQIPIMSQMPFIEPTMPFMEPTMPFMEPQMPFMEPPFYKKSWFSWLMGFLVICIIVLIVIKYYYSKSCEDSVNDYLSDVFANSFNIAYSKCIKEYSEYDNYDPSAADSRTPMSNLLPVSLSANDKCLRIGDLTSGAIPELYDCDGSEDQIFYYDEKSKNVLSKKNPNMVALHAKNDDTSLNQIIDIDIWKSKNTSQQFIYENNELKSVKNNKLCVDFKTSKPILSNCDSGVKSQKILMDKVYLKAPSYKTSGNLSDETQMAIALGAEAGKFALLQIIKRKLIPKLGKSVISLFRKNGLKLAYRAIKQALSKAGIEISEKFAILVGRKAGTTVATKVTEAAALKATAGTAVKVGTTVGRLANAAAAIFTVTSLVLDLLDVAGYAKLKTKKEFLDMKTELEKSLMESFNKMNLINPLIVGPLDKLTESEIEVLINKKIDYLLNPDNKIDEPLLNPILDEINKDLFSGKLKSSDLDNDDKMQPYILKIDSDKLMELVQKYICIEKNGRMVDIPEQGAMCSYKDADSCHKSYRWPPPEDIPIKTYADEMKCNNNIKEGWEVSKDDDGNKFCTSTDTYAEFRPNEYGGTCQIYSPGTRLICEENQIPYNFTTKVGDITKEYCQRKGAEWRMDESINDYDCNVPTEQGIAEALIGTTIVRGVKQMFDPDQFKECNYDSGETDIWGPEIIAMGSTTIGLGALAAGVGELVVNTTPKGKGYFCKSRSCPRKGYMRSNDKCVDLLNGSTDINTPIQMYDCNNTNAQDFYFYQNEKFIRSAKDRSMCLDVPDGEFKEGKQLQLYNCNFSKAQEFEYNNNMFNSTVNKDLCLDSANLKLKLAKCDNNSQTQKFTNGNSQMEMDLIGGLCYPECPPNMSSDENALCYEDCPKYGEIKINGRCLDLPNGSLANGTVPQLWDCNNSMAQKFYFNTDKTTISPVGHEDKCLDMHDIKEGNNVQLWDCNNTDAQKFIYNKNTQLFRSMKNPELGLAISDNKLKLTKDSQQFNMEGTRNMGLTCNLESSVANCPDSYTNMGLFCSRGADSYKAYDKWEDRYWTGDCPPGYFNDGTGCMFEPFGRGTGRDNAIYDGYQKCADEDGDGDRNNCEAWGVRVYPKCEFLAKKKGYKFADKWTNDSCCICSPESGYRHFDNEELIDGKSALQCPPAGHPNHTYNIGGFCYIPCKEGYSQSGLSCVREPSTLGPSSMYCANPDEHLDKTTGRCYTNPPNGFTNLGLFHSFNKSVKPRGTPISAIHIRKKERNVEFSNTSN